MATETRITVPAYINGKPNTSGETIVYQTNTSTGQTTQSTYSSQTAAQQAVSPSGSYVGSQSTYTNKNEPGVVRDTTTGNIVSQPAPQPAPSYVRVVNLPDKQGAVAVDLRSVGMQTGTSGYGGGVVAPGYTVGRQGKVIPVGGTQPTTQKSEAQQVIEQGNILAKISKGVGKEQNKQPEQEYIVEEKVQRAPLSYIGLNIFDRPYFEITKISTGEKYIKEGSTLTGFAVSEKSTGMGFVLPTSSFLNLNTLQPATQEETKVALKEEAFNQRIKTGIAVMGISGGGLVAKSVSDVAKPTVASITKKLLVNQTAKLTSAETAVMGKTLSQRLGMDVITGGGGKAFTKTGTTLIQGIPKAWTSSTGIYSPIASIGRSATTKVTPIISNRFFLPAVSFASAIAAPELTVAATKATTPTSINFTQEQSQALEAAGFELAQVESEFEKKDYTKQFEKEGQLVTETGYTYEPRANVPGLNVPIFGRITPYDIFPSVAVDVFTGGLYTSSFKKGVKQKALEMGFSEEQAVKAADYFWTTQGEARSRGEIIGLIPGTIGGEALGQALAKNSIVRGLSNAGINQVGKQFFYTTGKKAGELATLEAGKIIGKQVVVPLVVAGVAEGGTFGYLSSQAQGKKGVELGIATAFGAAAGGFSAPLFGAPIAKWAVTRPAASKIGMAGVYVVDYTESIGDIGASKIGGALSRTASRIPVKTFTTVSSIYPSSVPTGAFTQSFSPIPIQNNIPAFTPTPTPTPSPNTSITNIFNPTPTPTGTSISTVVNTPTNIFTSIFTPVNTPTPTVTPNLPITPFFGLPGDNAFSNKGSGKKRTKYYNELSAALGSFQSLDFGYTKSRSKGRKKVRVGGKIYYLGKKVKPIGVKKK